MKNKASVLSSLLVLSMAAGCSAGAATDGSGGTAASSGKEIPVRKEPVELTFYLYSISEKDFKQYYEQPLKEKFPYMTVKGIVPQKGQFISELVTADQVPDVIVGSKKAIEDTMKRFELGLDLNELIKKHNYDVSKLNPALLDSMKVNADGKIIGLPFDETRNVLFYNKDLFDKFGVPYPKDGMTWDDVYEAAKKLTRTEDGIAYRGYSERYHDLLLYQNSYGLSSLDLKEEKGAVSTDAWKKVVENMLRFYQLPGLSFTKQDAASEQDKNAFVKGLSAMQMFPQGASEWPFNWDVVSMPTYKDKPGVGSPVAARYNFITNTSKHPDDAFDAIAYLTSEELQLQAARNGAIPALKMNDKLQKAFKENDPLFAGKNKEAYFKYTYAPEIPPRQADLVQNFQLKGIAALENQLTDVISGGKDLNSALRAADEEITKALAAEKAKQK